MRLINWSCIVFGILFYAIMFYLFIVPPCFNNYREMQVNQFLIVVCVVFTILGSIFLFAGVAMLMTLKNHFRPFYLEYGRLLKFATIILALPLFIRAFFDGLRVADQNFSDKFVETGTIFVPLYDCLFFLFTELIPILSQIFSLTFGLIR